MNNVQTLIHMMRNQLTRDDISQASSNELMIAVDELLFWKSVINGEQAARREVRAARQATGRKAQP